MRSMSRKNHIVAIVFLTVVLLMCLYVSFVRESGRIITAEQAASDPDYSFLELSDYDRKTDVADAANIELLDGILEIDQGGDYHLSGSMNGMIHIDAHDQNVHLILDNVRIESDQGPAIYCESGGKLLITLADESANQIADSGHHGEYTDADACLYSACDLSFNGGGMLNVCGFYKDAIHSRDAIRIIGGNYTVKSKGNGIQGNDGILITGGIFAVSSEENSFRTTKKGARGRGDLIITGGDFSTISGRCSFVTAKADLHMSNCAVRDRSIYDTFSVGGNSSIQEGCVR